MLKGFTDTQLLEKVSEGKEWAFDEVHSKYAHRMYVYAFNILNKKQECEDIIQNIFVDFWVNRNKVTIVNLSSYLFRAVKFQVFNYFRSHKIATVDLNRLNIIDATSSTSMDLEFEELEKVIQDNVLKLPKRCQEIFRMSRFENKSHKEIANELDISLQGVKNQVSKALKIIRGNLQKEKLIFFTFFYK
jgi:RNA polymerase sigma-70 factor (ECF subfamily)